MRRFTLLASVVLLLLVVVRVQGQRKKPVCEGACGIQINDHLNVAGDGQKKDDRLKTDKQMLTWRFHHWNGPDIKIDIGQFAPEDSSGTPGSAGTCPGPFYVNGVLFTPVPSGNSYTCASLLFTDKKGQTVSYGPGGTSGDVFKFAIDITEKDDNGNWGSPNRIDPELEIDTAFGNLNWLSILGGLLAGILVTLGAARLFRRQARREADRHAGA